MRVLRALNGEQKPFGERLPVWSDQHDAGVGVAELLDANASAVAFLASMSVRTCALVSPTVASGMAPGSLGSAGESYSG